MKHNIYEFSLFLKILCFVFKGSLNIPEYIVQYLYIIEHAVENIIGFKSISVTLLSLGRPHFGKLIRLGILRLTKHYEVFAIY